jgi:hypothetical protein
VVCNNLLQNKAGYNKESDRLLDEHTNCIRLVEDDYKIVSKISLSYCVL